MIISSLPRIPAGAVISADSGEDKLQRYSDKIIAWLSNTFRDDTVNFIVVSLSQGRKDIDPESSLGGFIRLTASRAILCPDIFTTSEDKERTVACVLLGSPIATAFQRPITARWCSSGYFGKESEVRKIFNWETPEAVAKNGIEEALRWCEGEDGNAWIDLRFNR